MAITGNFDGIFDGKATGWAVDKADYDKPVLVQIFAGDRMIAEALAKEPRKDLAAAGVSAGNGGFAIPLGDALLDANVEVTARVKPGGGALFGGPHKLPASNKPAIYIDGFIQRNVLTGWIKDHAQPERTFTIQLFEDEELIGETSSDGLIDGQNGVGRFTFLIPPEILDGALHRFIFHCKELGWTFETRSFLTPRHNAVDETIEYPFLDNSAWEHTRSAQASRTTAQAMHDAQSALSPQIAAVQATLASVTQTDKARIHDLLCQLGYLHTQAAELADAEHAFERAAALGIGGAEATVNLADTLRKQGKVPAAQAVLDKALKKDPDSAELLECQDRIAQGQRKDTARVIAFYLPQFHPTPENDEWWGKGFTEWTNVTSATPLFDGHLQPRRPTELGYYDLRLPEVANAQFDLARRFGIDAFCYYYYWFDGKRVLDRPLQDLIDGKTGPFPFCVCWANEDWTRSWDGQSGEVLLAQNHSEESDFRFIQDLAPALKHPDYVRIDGKPVVLIYRAEKLANAVKTTAAWRKWCIDEGIGELHLCAVQSFGFDDPRPYGFDAAVEFPPHAVHEKYPETTYHERLQRLPGLVERFNGSVFNYEVFADAFIHRPREPYRLYRGCFLAWDNTARRGKAAHVFHNFSVEKYVDWLSTSGARTAREGDNALAFVNAWNEWAEGAVLEPDATFGHALLEATRRAKSLIPYKRQQTFWKHGVPDLQLAPLAQLHRVVLIGHDAHAHGAQINLLNMARSLKRDHGINVTILLLESGTLHQEYEKVGETILLSKEEDWQTKLIVLARHLSSIGTRHAICNTVVTGEAAKILRTEGFRVVSLVHELPSLIEANGLQAECWHIAAHAHNIVFASSIVAREFNNRYWANEENILIAPQGIAFNGRLAKREHWRQQVRAELGIPAEASIVMGCGYGDIRKGVDLFVQAAAEISRQCTPTSVAFVWVGSLEGTLDKYVRADVARLGLCDRFFITGRVTDADRYYVASDIFALTSREDPFPSVVMEAYDAGLPVVAFDGGGGYVDIINADTGALVPYLDVTAMAGAIATLLKDPKKLARVAKHVHAFCRANFSYKNYMAKLLALLKQAPAIAVTSR
jgi:glycosyltransferase involved in cell wall biosynthesis/tetratricopeptide (TPR) repeat protein